MTKQPPPLRGLEISPPAPNARRANTAPLTWHYGQCPVLMLKGQVSEVKNFWEGQEVTPSENVAWGLSCAMKAYEACPMVYRVDLCTSDDCWSRVLRVKSSETIYTANCDYWTPTKCLVIVITWTKNIPNEISNVLLPVIYWAHGLNFCRRIQRPSNLLFSLEVESPQMPVRIGQMQLVLCLFLATKQHWYHMLDQITASPTDGSKQRRDKLRNQIRPDQASCQINKSAFHAQKGPDNQ